MATNTQILGAVIGKFAAPLLTQIGSQRLGGIPAVAALQNKIRSSGWAGASWTLASELEPFADIIAQGIAAPLATRLIGNIPDEAVPSIAHGIVGRALENGELKLLEGRICLDRQDLERLKAMLEKNLPLNDNGTEIKE